MEPITQHMQILPEDTLKQIGKGALVKFTHACDNPEKVSRVYHNLLDTYSTASLSHSHTTAACNALSAFLDAALVSNHESTRQLVYCDETWLSVFDVFMTRYKDAKPKPMKQVMESLVLLLAKTRKQFDRSSLQKKIVELTIPSIMLGEPRARLKASFASLEMIVRKNAIVPSELISLLDGWLHAEHESWVPMYQADCKALSIDVSPYIRSAPVNSTPAQDASRTTVEIFALGLLARATKPELAASSGDLMAAFFQKIKATPDLRHLLSVWVAPVRHVTLRTLDDLEYMSNYILQPCFEVDTIGFRSFIDRFPLKNLLSCDMSDAPMAEFMVLFASLQVAKKIGLVHEDHYVGKPSSTAADADRAFVLKSEVIGQFLFHRDMTIRIATLSLLISAPSSTKAVSSATMKAIINGLPSLHCESESYSRGEVLSLIRKLVVRLKGGILEDQDRLKSEKVTSNKEDQQNFFNSSVTRKCLDEYIRFLKADLRPTASYPRHIAALKTLIFFIESGLDHRFSATDGNKSRWACNMDIFEPTLLRLLVDLLLDPFEEVRATSLYLLNLFPREVLFSSDLQPQGELLTGTPQIIDGLTKAEQMASNTSRADYADTVARLYHILFRAAESGSITTASQWWEAKSTVVEYLLAKLEQKLSSSGGLFNSSMRDAPLHGYISALRYIVATPNFYSLVSHQSTNFDNWRAFHVRIVHVCDRIWNEVRPVLCIDSPEGHTDDPIEELGVGPKDILSYSWRALRESSLLLHATLSNKSYSPPGDNGLTEQHFDKLGTLSFIQLAELRHRGAFSTVSQTFATCCQRCGQSSDPAISELPHRFYQEAKKTIFESASKLTRRSAGLPALVVGILSSNPGGPLFQQVIQELHEISHLPAQHDKTRQDVPLPQVHAMNCLKDIFTNTKLGPHTEPFIMPALHLSAERLGSPIWALRNSGLMLFRALLTRMCRTGTDLGFGGESGSEPGARVTFQKYPGLFELLPTLLTPTDKNNSAEQTDTAMVTERVFPALELIAEKVPDVTGAQDEVLRGLVREQLKSPVWGIREHAARVYASLLHRGDILINVKALMGSERDSKTQDYLHGEALCIKYSLRRFASSSVAFWNENIDVVSSTIRDIFAASFPLAESPFIATTLLEIMSDTIEKSIDCGSEGKLMASTLDFVANEYAFQDILDFVFDPNHPTWKSLSTTRASSLLRRAISWVSILQLIIAGKVNDLEPLLRTVSNFDPNAGQWLLERLQEIFGQRDQYGKTLINLYSSVILGDYPEEVKAIAISCLASKLQALFDFHNETLPQIDLPWGALEGQLKHGSSQHIWNRDRSDAELQLHGSLLAAKAIASNNQNSENDINEWATRLRFAMQEETEYTTRLAAVLSISAFGRILRPAGQPPLTDKAFLDIYLVLYDMLNDDDEELRDLAAPTASWVLSYSSASRSKAVALSPSNASELLSVFIAESYNNSQLLSKKAVAYIVGSESRISTFTTRFVPVSTTLSELRKESTILFEEEKQNLFIDDVREVDAWTKRLIGLTETSYDEASIQAIFIWVSDGLSCFANVFANPAGKDGLLGWVSKPETFTLGVRLFALATVTVSKDSAASKLLGQERVACLKEKLQVLLAHGQASLVHNDWITRIRAALECS
ncbi:THADA/TRM732 family protein [Aspergillus homomorphus CBS 101889]|uniref:HEAT repeat protein n=1 Tax=Aspergillus homomorphus (strain CBS 101889) TaxID=1450537 RepID=A0A395I2D7_ASPHC|nr:HEAT repeat protein [Aspergillus homomorphus CBS 101889]RAL13849.1 HEAT repeat protein [Aspergillus homomorphus CBS 101889]